VTDKSFEICRLITLNEELKATADFYKARHTSHFGKLTKLRREVLELERTVKGQKNEITNLNYALNCVRYNRPPVAE